MADGPKLRGANSLPEEGYDAYVDCIARGAGISSAGQGVGRLLGYATPTLAGLAAACAYAALLALAPPPGVPTLVVFIPLFLAVFMGMLAILGLSSSDRRLLGSFWEAVRRTIRTTLRRESG